VKKLSFELDLKNVEISLLSKFYQNATISSGVIVLKWLVGRTHGRTDRPILISRLFLQKAGRKK